MLLLKNTMHFAATAVLLLVPLLLAAVVRSHREISKNKTPLVQVNGSRFVEATTGRSVLFHGVNAVYKIPPYLPELEGFDPRFSLSSVDAKNLREWGFNAVRLGVMMVAVLPRRNAVNHTYLSQVRRQIEILAAEGIYTLVDMHQDLLSERLCGEVGPPPHALVCEENTFPSRNNTKQKRPQTKLKSKPKRKLRGFLSGSSTTC